MLELTRRQNKSIIIDGDNKIIVLGDRHGEIVLGVEAPDDVEIWRKELIRKRE